MPPPDLPVKPENLQSLQPEHKAAAAAVSHIDTPRAAATALAPADPEPVQVKDQAKEVGGRGGLEPTRFGDWEKNGRCIDF